MTVILLKCFSVAMMIMFIHATTWEGMIFEGVRKIGYRLPLWIKKPLYLCPICMTSIWGTALWFLQVEFIIYLLVVGGMLTVIVGLINNREMEKEDELPRSIF